MKYDVVIVGGGHAGCEAAHAAARMGCKTLLVTLDPSRIGVMSCNPAIGGLAKGQLVKEVDALGGLMARVTDQASIQYRVLNRSKGPAVQSSRAQCDKQVYSDTMKAVLKQVQNLEVRGGEISNLRVESGRVVSVEISGTEWIDCTALVVTSGTFLKAVMHRGTIQDKGGRLGDQSADVLSQGLQGLGFRLRRLKTGTPPRLHRNSIDWDRLGVQAGDVDPRPFSFFYDGSSFPVLEQKPCHITYTNKKTHDVILENLKLSAMYSGAITGVGPRYCPSVEDKVVRFQDKERHQIFLEPEGLDVDEVYVNGMSTSLPVEIQEKFIRSIEGLEEAQFLQYGYAVEYDAVDSRQLKRTFESKDVAGLFFAGQVNGTSGYEEAAA
jgi:tRNA uridine 5-carboxymethylaminomethyl modification enzyme